MVSNIFYVHPYLGKIPISTNMFQVGWNHQPGMHRVPNVFDCIVSWFFDEKTHFPPLCKSMARPTKRWRFVIRGHDKRIHLHRSCAIYFPFLGPQNPWEMSVLHPKNISKYGLQYNPPKHGRFHDVETLIISGGKKKTLMVDLTWAGWKTPHVDGSSKGFFLLIRGAEKHHPLGFKQHPL